MTAPFLPPGTVSSEFTYWRTGDGRPETGGTIGCDAKYFNAAGVLTVAAMNEIAGKVVITEAEYDALVAVWAAYNPSP